MTFWGGVTGRVYRICHMRKKPRTALCSWEEMNSELLGEMLGDERANFFYERGELLFFVGREWGKHKAV